MIVVMDRSFRLPSLKIQHGTAGTWFFFLGARQFGARFHRASHKVHHPEMVRSQNQKWLGKDHYDIL